MSASHTMTSSATRPHLRRRIPAPCHGTGLHRAGHTAHDPRVRTAGQPCGRAGRALAENKHRQAHPHGRPGNGIRSGTTRIKEHWTSRERVEFWLTAETIAFGNNSFSPWQTKPLRHSMADLKKYATEPTAPCSRPSEPSCGELLGWNGCFPYFGVTKPLSLSPLYLPVRVRIKATMLSLSCCGSSMPAR